MPNRKRVRVTTEFGQLDSGSLCGLLGTQNDEGQLFLLNDYDYKSVCNLK